ncbi:hypothetical protein CYMTET_18890 [Cymbomonas tetramitiformis]|uniref:Uncharacterized protein n=1 Tax=Cymbomonas tetramitiformis TaxID=36881 RepID=A0AAE0L5F6_9CHLO|nr:hypothetical protein CYMTET_18890 [Cymbomonas tetramitiformis]
MADYCETEATENMPRAPEPSPVPSDHQSGFVREDGRVDFVSTDGKKVKLSFDPLQDISYKPICPVEVVELKCVGYKVKNAHDFDSLRLKKNQRGENEECDRSGTLKDPFYCCLAHKRGVYGFLTATEDSEHRVRNIYASIPTALHWRQLESKRRELKTLVGLGERIIEETMKELTANEFTGSAAVATMETVLKSATNDATEADNTMRASAAYKKLEELSDEAVSVTSSPLTAREKAYAAMRKNKGKSAASTSDVDTKSAERIANLTKQADADQAYQVKLQEKTVELEARIADMEKALDAAQLEKGDYEESLGAEIHKNNELQDKNNHLQARIDELESVTATAQPSEPTAAFAQNEPEVSSAESPTPTAGPSSGTGKVGRPRKAG